MRMCLVTLTCLVVTTACGWAGPATAAEIRIGVVNVREVFARYRKAEDLRKANEKKLAPRKRDLERRQRELIRRAGEIQQFQGQTDEETKRLREVKELEHQEYMLKLDYRQLQRDVQAANERAMRRLWDELAQACRRIAEAEGYDLILKLYGRDPSAATDRERLEAFQTDALLYVAPSMDMTPRVLEVLEDAYRRGIKLVPDEADESPEGGRGSAPPAVRPESRHG